MPKFLIKANYSVEGIKGLLAKGGSARVASVTSAIAGVGGSVECFYFALGDHDAFLVVDLPDTVSAAALALQVGASGGASTEVVTLLTPEQVDAAAKMTIGYTPPGG